MAGAFGNLNGSGPQQAYVWLSYVSYNQASNYSTWYYEAVYKGNGWGSWSNSTQYWSLSGFAAASGAFTIPSPGTGDITLASGTFVKYHNAAGYLSPGTLTLGINTDHSSIGDGSASVGSGTPPRIPKVPSQPVTPTFQSASTTAINFSIQSPSDNGGSTVSTYNIQVSRNAAFTDLALSYNSGASNQVASPLAPGNPYWIRYRAVNGVGVSAWSGAMSASTLPATPPSIGGSSTIPGTGATIILGPPSGSTGVTKYTVERRLLNTTTPVTSTDTPSSPLNVTGLTPGAIYQYRASAWFGTYQSPWTNWISVVQSNPNTDAGDYFDGGTADTPAVSYSWAGAAHNSKSLGQASQPTGWRTFAESATVSGGTGAVFRASGGVQGSYSARALFLTDAAAAGFAFGTSNSVPAARADIEGGGHYFGSIYAWPSRAQRLRAVIRWYTAAGTYISLTAGAAASVIAGRFTRLTANGTAPSNAQWASVVVEDVAGTGWTPWKSGEWLHLDAAMVTLQELYPYFDGSTRDSSSYRYDWLGAVNASASSRTTLQQSEIDSLLDPDCPPPPAPPAAPTIVDACIDEVGTWRRYWSVIPEAEVSDWIAMLPTIRVTTGGSEARQVRVRIYENPQGATPETFDSRIWNSEQIISYMPASTTLTLDGVDQRVFAEVNGADPIAADKLLFGTGGTPATWPTLSCGIGYLLSFDVPLEAPVGNVSVGIDLTRRI